MRLNLILPTAWVYGAEIAHGVIEASARMAHWTLHLQRDGSIQRRGLGHWLANNPGDAAIVLPRFRGCTQLVAAQCPVTVAVCDDDLHNLTRVGIDDDAVGVAAGEHLRGRGFHHFAYVRNTEGWSAARERGFTQGCGEEPSCLPPGADSRRMDRWLASLGTPVGLFAGNDRTAARILESSQRLGLSIPHDLAVLGADDDQLLCLSMRPGLSSVRVPWREVGRSAVRALEQLLDGRQPEPVKVPPLGIQVRPSTDILSVSDALAARAMSWITIHAAEGINVADVVRHLGVSRSQLERHCAMAFGNGPLQAIRRARIDVATRLLRDTPLPLAVVARSAGFPTSAAMHATFHSLLRMTPAAYRSLARR